MTSRQTNKQNDRHTDTGYLYSLYASKEKIQNILVANSCANFLNVLVLVFNLNHSGLFRFP